MKSGHLKRGLLRGVNLGMNWRIALRFFGNSKVDIFQWLLLEMVIWMEIFFLPIQQGCPSIPYIIEVIHKEEVGGGFYIPNIDFFSILNVGCFFRAEIPAR